MKMYDVAVIGAGVTGSMTARLLSFTGLKTIVLEKGDDLASGASRANSAVVHAGYDPVPGTLKAKLNVRGTQLMEQTCRELDVPYKPMPSLVVAFNEKQTETLRALLERGEKNGVKGLRLIDSKELHELEPALSPDAVGALYADSAVISPYKLTIAAAENAAVNGVEFLFNTEVRSIEFDGDFTINGTIRAHRIVNCAGVGSAHIASLIGDDSFSIIPRRGEYMLYDKNSLCVSSVIFTVPTEKGKGVLVLPTDSGNMLVGPNADAIEDGADTSTTAQGLAFVLENAKKSVPSLSSRGVITQFSGVRATPTTDDFVIAPSKANPLFINAAGIESPGLASSPAVAEYVLSLLEKSGADISQVAGRTRRIEACPHFAELDDAEKEALIARDPLFGHVICRCETITEAEIVDAIRRPLGARTVDGVKLRTRAGMGRCQGGFCSPKVAAILARELGVPLTEISKRGSGKLLTGDTK